MASTRSTLYRLARLLGDVEAAKKGPAAYARRRARRVIHRQAGRAAQRVSRGLGV